MARKRAKSKDVEKLLRELERQVPDCVSGGGGKALKIKCPVGGKLVIIHGGENKTNRGLQNAIGLLRQGGFDV